MRRQIEFTRRAVTDLDNLDSVVRERVIAALHRYAETNQGNLIKLSGRGNEWRLRVGDWRVRLELDDEEAIINVLRVRHRREAYR